MESVAILSYSNNDAPTVLYMRSFFQDEDNISSTHFLDQVYSNLNKDDERMNSGESHEFTSGASISSQFRMMATMDEFDRLEGIERTSSPEIFRKEAEHGTNGFYLGFITAMDDIRFYGYRTATQIRIVIGVRDDIPLAQTELLHQRDVAIQNALSNIHQAYISHLMNPFSIPGKPIKCKRFDSSIQNITFTIR